jgi:hypothetical protein
MTRDKEVMNAKEQGHVEQASSFAQSSDFPRERTLYSYFSVKDTVIFIIACSSAIIAGGINPLLTVSGNFELNHRMEFSLNRTLRLYTAS